MSKVVTEYDKIVAAAKNQPPQFAHLNTVALPDDLQDVEDYSVDNVVTHFHVTYYGLKNAFGVHSNPRDKTFKNGKDGKLDKKGYVDKNPYNDAVIAEHLAGKTKIGSLMNIPDTANFAKERGCDPNIADNCWWCAIDVDEYNNPALHKKLHDKIKKFNLPLVISRSSSDAAHVTMHFKGMSKTSHAREILKCLIKLLELDPDTEIFPKQDELNLALGDYGNFLYLPYFGGDNSEQYSYNDDFKRNSVFEHCYYVDSKRTSIQEMLELIDPHEESINVKWDDEEEVYKDTTPHEPKSNANGQFEQAAVQQESAELGLDYGEDDDEIDDEDKTWKDVLVEGPPCLQAIVKDHPKKNGTLDFRNEILKQIAVMMSQFKELDDETLLAISDDLHEENPLKSKEVRRIVKSQNEKKYDFKCKAEPFSSRCNSDQCHINKYGKGIGKEYAGLLSNYVLVRDKGEVVRVRPNNKPLSIHAAVASMRSEVGQIINKTKKMSVEKYFLDVVSKWNGVDTEDWSPGQPIKYSQAGPFGTSKAINAYKPSGVVATAGTVSPLYFKLLDLQFSNEEQFEVDDAATGDQRRATLKQLWVEFLAHIIQKPYEKTDLGWVWKSKGQGSGKSFWQEIMEVLLGEWNVNLINIADLQANWADPYMEVLLVAVEEVYEQGSKDRKKIAANVKRLITALSQKGNMKCKTYKKGKLLARFFFMSNEDSPLQISDFDRRYVVHEPSNTTPELLAETKIVCTKLKKWLVEENGYSILLNYLQTYDISHFNPRMRAPETEAKAKMVWEGMDYDKKQLIREYKDQEHPFMEGLHLYDPKAIAAVSGKDHDWVVKLFKEELGFVKVGVVQNCQFVIPVGCSGLSNNDPMNVTEGGKIKAHLWTDKPSIKADFVNGKLKPMDLLQEFVRPVVWHSSKVHTWAVDKRLYEKVDRFGKVYGDPKLPEWFDELYEVEKSCF